MQKGKNSFTSSCLEISCLMVSQRRCFRCSLAGNLLHVKCTYKTKVLGLIIYVCYKAGLMISLAPGDRSCIAT